MLNERMNDADAFDWDFHVVDVTTWSSDWAGDVLGLDPDVSSFSPFGPDAAPQPWVELGGLIRTDADVLLSFYVMPLQTFISRRRYEASPIRQRVELILARPGAPALYVGPYDDEPTSLVDAEWFDMNVIDAIVFAEPRVRRRLLSRVDVASARVDEDEGPF